MLEPILLTYASQDYYYKFVDEAVDKEVVSGRTSTNELVPSIPLSPTKATEDILAFLNGDKKDPEVNTAAYLQFGGKLARISLYTYGNEIKFGTTILNVDKIPSKFKEKFQITDLPQKPEDTTNLYIQLGDIAETVSNTTRKVVIQEFSSEDSKMIAWLRSKGTKLGFNVTEETPARISAQRVYTPI